MNSRNETSQSNNDGWHGLLASHVAAKELMPGRHNTACEQAVAPDFQSLAHGFYNLGIGNLGTWNLGRISRQTLDQNTKCLNTNDLPESYIVRSSTRPHGAAPFGTLSYVSVRLRTLSHAAGQASRPDNLASRFDKEPDKDASLVLDNNLPKPSVIIHLYTPGQPKKSTIKDQEVLFRAPGAAIVLALTLADCLLHRLVKDLLNRPISASSSTRITSAPGLIPCDSWATPAR